jgi:hypothetical protein
METEDELRSRLKSAPPDAAAFQLNIAEVFKRARARRLRRPVVAGAVALLVLTGVGVPLALLSGLGSNARLSTRPYISTPSPSSGECEFPAFQPTYLPWVTAGRPVPAPDAFHDPMDDSATLHWSRPGTDLPYYVALTRESYSLDGSGPGETIAVAIPGAASGQLYIGETPGDEDIYWNVGPGPCSEFVLELSTNDMSRAESKAAIIKIAESFQAQTVPPAVSG